MSTIGQSPLTTPFYSTIPINRIGENRAPNSGDWQNYVLGDEWLDTTSNDWWKLVSLANNQGLWVLIGGTNAAIETLTGDTGGAVPPDASNNLNVLGGDTTTVTGNPATNTLTIDASTSGYPITKYVVGPVGEAGYQTIQSALDAANAAGGGAVWVKPEGSPYNENLTLYDKTQVIGAIAPGDTLDLVINGVHTPPDTGSFMFRNIWFQSATDIFNSVAAGSADLFIIDSVLQITNGFTFNLIDWTGTCVVFNCGEQSTNNGHIQNTGGATAFFTNASIGKGVVNTMVTSGVTELYNVIVDCPVDFQTGATGVISGGSRFKTNVTFSNNSSLKVTNSFFDTGSAQSITYNSSANSSFSNITVDSTNNPSIGGTGAGSMTISGINFLNNYLIADTLTFSTNGIIRSAGQVIGPQGELSHTINGSPINSDLEIHSEGSQDLGGLAIHRHTDTSLFGSHVINLRSNGTHSSPTIVTDGDIVSRYLSAGYDGTDYAQMAEIRSEVDGTPGTNDMPGRWIFTTSPDGSQVPVEALRIDANQDSTFSGNVLIEKSESGSDLSCTISNTSNTASSDSTSIVQVAGTSAGDPIRSLTVTGGVTFNEYLDNSDTDAFKEDIVGLGTVRKIFSTKGESLLPFQPVIAANVSMDQTNATGASTRYDIICDSESFDVGGNYNNATGVYTIPETGFYFTIIRAYLSNITAAMTSGRLGMILNGAGGATPGPNIIYPNPANTRTPTNEIQHEFSFYTQYTKGDTIQPYVIISGGAGDTATVKAAGTTFGIFLNQ